jgi:hypothetical protein
MKPHFVSGAPSAMKSPTVNLLQSWDDPVCTGPVRRKQQLVNPASCIPASPMPAHLRKPSPDGFRRCVDGRGVVGHHLWD